MMGEWMLVGLAVVAEITAAIALRFSHGFTKPLPTALALMAFGAAFYAVSLALVSLPVSVVYPVWAGGGTAGVALVGVLLLREGMNPWKGLGIVLVVMGVIVLNLTPESDAQAKASRQAIGFTLPDLAGKPHALNEYLQRGPVILVFFTTWCPNCKKEIPVLKQLYREYSERKLQLVSINAGLADSLENAKRYALQNRLPYVVLYDADGKVAAHYGVRDVPQIFYIRQDGSIAHISRHASRQAIEGLLEAER